MKPDDSRLEALRRYADGEATPQDIALLDNAVRTDAAFLEFMIEYMHVDAALPEFVQAADATDAIANIIPMPEVSQPVARRRSDEGAQTPREPGRATHPGGMPARTVRRWFIPAAAAAALIITASLWLMRSPAGIEVEVLRVADSSLRVGDRVKMQTLALEQGEAQVRLPSEVKLTLSGAGEVRFIDPMHARVVHGKVTVDVGAKGKGFILDTPQTRVVDLGTQFGVEARSDGLTDVMVIEGKIELHDAQRVTPLEQGEAVRVNEQREQQRIVSITGGPKRTDWSTAPPPAECVIRSVKDNYAATGEHHFYRIVPRGLVQGAASYANRDQLWAAKEGSDFPASLTNADLVQTFRGARKRQTFEIEVTLSRPAVLYVLMPKSSATPEWLARDFTRSTDELTVRNGDVHSRIQMPCEVWQRTISAPDTVKLGPAPREVKGGVPAMYGIAAKAL